MKSSPNYILSFVATFIALLALSVAVLDHCEERRHNKKTVTPILKIEKKEIQSIYGIFISNQGYGPAIIDSCEIFYNKTKIISNDIWDEIFKVHFTEPINYSIQYNKCQKGLVIGVNEEKYLWGANARELDNDIKLFDSAIEKISIKLYYHSIYDDDLTAYFNCIL